MRNFRRGAAPALAGIAWLLFGSCGGSRPEGESARLPESVLDAKIAQYVRVPMPFDASGLPGWQKDVLRKLIDAGRLIDRAFWDQAYPAGWDLRMRLEASEDSADRKALRLLVINAGPFDRLHEFEPFYGTDRRPPGAGFYPARLTRSELETYLEDHPDEREALLDPFAVVRRDGDRLVAVPYHVEYRKWIEPAASLLREAAAQAEHPALARVLASRAEALMNDDYFQSDLDWIDLGDSPLELVFGPYETYEDHLMGVKTAYEATIAVKDPDESRRLEVYVRNLAALERNLPMEAGHKRAEVPLDSPMVVVTDIFRGGDIAHGYQPVAANLPNDPRVHEQKGTKKTFWKNVMAARLEKIIQPIAREIVAEEQLELMTPQGYFNVVLMHEIAHALGPRWVGTGEDRQPVNELLKEEYSAIEEGKADVAGLHSLEWFMEQGVIPPELGPEHYVSYLGGLFRTIRFGTTEAHGKASIIAINWHRENGGITFDPETGRWAVDLDQIPASVTSLARELLAIEATGDRDRAIRLSETYSRVGPDVRATLDRLGDLPVDVEPIYSVTWD